MTVSRRLYYHATQSGLDLDLLLDQSPYCRCYFPFLTSHDFSSGANLLHTGPQNRCSCPFLRGVVLLFDSVVVLVIDRTTTITNQRAERIPTLKSPDLRLWGRKSGYIYIYIYIYIYTRWGMKNQKFLSSYIYED